MRSNSSGQVLDRGSYTQGDGRSRMAAPHITGSFTSRSSVTYDIQDKIGAGGMGVVYRATDRRLGRTVALKFLSSVDDKVARERFLREAQAASMLDHPNIGTIYGIEEDESGALCIAMAWHDGETVADLISRGPVPESEALRIAIAVADGLAAAHQRGIIHRDIKPSNIMLTRTGGVKIVDFGLARFAERDQTLTTPYGVMGTAAYMAPEQLRGHPADARSDCWALGAVLYEMLSGRRPFSGDGVLAQVYAVVHQDPEPLQTGVPGLARAVGRALNKAPDSRFTSAAAFGDALRECANEAGIAYGTPTTRPGVSVVSKHPKAWIAAAAAAVVVGVGAWTLLKWPAAAPKPITVAVLPFTSTQDPATAALATGLAEAVSNSVAKLERFSGTLTVVPASETMSRNVRDEADARKVLGATVVVTGTLSRSRGVSALDLTIRDTRQSQPFRLRIPASDLRDIQQRAAIELSSLLDIRATSVAMQRSAVAPPAWEAYLRGLGYLQRWDKPENLDAAVSSFGEALRYEPRMAAAYVGLAEAARTRFRTEKDAANLQHALNYSQQAIGIDERVPEGHVVLARIYQETGRLDKAVTEFARAMELDPRSATAMTGMGKTLEELGRMPEAEAAHRKAVALNPFAWTPLNMLGGFYLRRGRHGEAESTYRRALSITPDNPAVHSNLGVALNHLRRSDEAVAAFRRATELGTSYAAWVNLGNVLYWKRDFRAAAQQYDRALQLNGRDFRVWGTRGQALRLAGDRGPEVGTSYRRAITLGEEALLLTPRQPRIGSLLAVYYAALGDAANARRRLPASSATEYSALLDAAVACEILGDRAEAVRFATLAVQQGAPWQDVRDDPDLEALVRSGLLKQPKL